MDPTSEREEGTDRQWVAGRAYAEGDVIWYKGTYWRCEEGHQGDVAHVIGPPDMSLHLWTPISSTTAYLPGGEMPSVPNFASAADTPLESPHPQGFSSSTNLVQSDSPEKDDSPDSQQTVTPRSRSWDQIIAPVAQMPAIPESGRNSPVPPPRSVPLTGTASYFAAKADEGIRYLALKHEKHKATMADELKAEIRGDRVWRLGGMGMWAYSQETLKELEKEELWRDEGERLGREGWLDSARKRTEYYTHSLGLKPLIQWRLHTPQSGPLPPSALPIGFEGDGAPLYAARAWHEGGLHLGKAGPHLHLGASISYAGAEITLDTFEVLCGPDDGGSGVLLKWMMFRHGETCGVNGWQPVEGGREKSGEALFVSKGDWEHIPASAASVTIMRMSPGVEVKCGLDPSRFWRTLTPFDVERPSREPRTVMLDHKEAGSKSSMIGAMGNSSTGKVVGISVEKVVKEYTKSGLGAVNTQDTSVAISTSIMSNAYIGN